MHIQDLNGKKICILGFGKEGQAMLNALEEHSVKADITIADAKEAISDKRLAASYQLGNEYLADLDRFDVIIKSPGIPVKAELEAVKDKITSGTQIFFDSVHATGAMIIGITGSKGKSTTSSLIFELVKAHGKDVYLIGNIGKPVIEYISAAKAGTIFVEEMSSYQLMDLTVSPHIAVVTSFFPEHLDYHGSLEAYKDAKKHIARFQSAEDTIFYNAKSPGAIEIAEESKGQHVPFSDEDAPVQIEDTHLLGVHNLSNIAGAFKVARSLGVPVETCIQVFKDFHGLPHRLQSLGIHHDIEWIDDAISTTPESAIAALDALGDRVQTIILGGQDRGVDFKELGKRVAKSNIQTVILIGETADRIHKSLKAAKYKGGIKTAESMEQIVQIAKDKTLAPSPQSLVPIVLLSTASPSYDMFKNFEEKGDQFAACIRALE